MDIFDRNFLDMKETHGFIDNLCSIARPILEFRWRSKYNIKIEKIQRLEDNPIYNMGYSNQDSLGITNDIK